MPDAADEAQITADMNLQAAIAAAAPVIEEQVRDDAGHVVCVDCDQPIPPARLAAVPWACRCVACQEAWEDSRC